VAYESLSFKRSQQLKRLEEQTRATQLERFLSQFQLDKTVLRNFAPSFYENLRLEGIRMAADVTSARLRKAPLVGAGLAQILLNWRNELEREFVFDPQTTPPHLRIKLERKLDETRERLEHDLRGGAFYLNRLKDEIKASQQALYAPLLAAQTKLAQAEKDCEAVAKRNPFWPLAVLLLVSFFFGLVWGTHIEYERRVTDQIAQPAPISHTAPIETTRQPDPGFIQPEPGVTETEYYLHGWDLVKQARYKDAERRFRQAIRVNPRFAGGYKGLAYTLYQLRKYDEALEASQKAISLAIEFQPYYIQGLVYFEQGNWAEARTALITAIRLEKAPVQTDQYVDAHYKLAASIVRLGEAYSEIQALREQFARGSRDPLLTIRLGTLYLLTGNLEAAKRVQSDEIGAAVLSDLMRQQGVQ
jgi:tetratricopeptide (TPR) repeat protein